MALVRCDGCRGTKRKNGLGGMVKTCDECSGIGWREEAVEKKKSIFPDDIDDGIPAKMLAIEEKRKAKRGRKPRIKE